MIGRLVRVVYAYAGSAGKDGFSTTRLKVR